MRDQLRTLSLLARGLSGLDLDVQTLVASQGTRPIIVGKRLLLPEDTNDQLGRAMVAHAVAHLRYSRSARPVRTLKPMGVAVISAFEDARVERLLKREFSGVHNWFAANLAPNPDPLDLRFAALIARMDRILVLPDWQDDNHWVNKARRLFDETVAHMGLEDYDAFRSVASILANDLGQMRVRFEPQDYIVPAQYRDDNSYLWDFGDSDVPPDEAIALNQSGAKPIPPPDTTTEGVSVPPELEVGMEIGRYSYPEWNHKVERLRPDWCTVIEKVPAWQGIVATAVEAYANKERYAPHALPRARHLDRRHRLRRQWEGDDIDLNAAVEVLVDRRLRLRPDPRLFMRPGRASRPSSLLVLLDLSESVNDVGNEQTSLLDLEKEAALQLASSNARGTDRLAVHGFSSNTRDEVYYYRLLDFGRPLEASACALISGVRGRYSTRIGAALRHAASLLCAEPQGQRSILVITDGAPSDIDVHDPVYLIEDARQAVILARRLGIRSACIAVDSSADSYVHRIFGWQNYCIADNSLSLSTRLARMSQRLAAAC
jgi:nitric oxide reductase NorD protein